MSHGYIYIYYDYNNYRTQSQILFASGFLRAVVYILYQLEIKQFTFS